MQFFVKGFPLDNPPSWDEYLTFDPYRTGHIRNILFENLIFLWNRFKYMLSYWLLQKEYTKSPNQSSWKYIPLIAGLTRPMWMMCDPCHNYWDAVVINSILAELKTRFFRNLPSLSFVFSGMPYFGFSHILNFQVLMETFDDDSATILKAIGSKVTMKELTSHNLTKWRKTK